MKELALFIIHWFGEKGASELIIELGKLIEKE